MFGCHTVGGVALGNGGLMSDEAIKNK